MNKGELISAIASDADISKEKAAAALNSFIENAKETLKSPEGKLTLIGFGTFSISHRQEREGRNPKTKEIIKIPAKNVVKFKPGKELSELVNS